MSILQKISGYFKQLTGEVVGSQALHEEGRRQAFDGTVDAPATAGTPEGDAAGQFHQSRAGADNDGIVSAKPRVITGSDDATVHRDPPGEETGDPDWSSGFDDRAPRLD